MPRTVQCVYLKKQADGLDYAPYPGELGTRIYNEVSKEAWALWLKHQTMLINEYRLDVTSEQGQRIWFAELDKYFWGDGSSAPPDFVPEG